MESRSEAAGQLPALLRSRMSELRGSELRVAQVLLEQGGELVRLSVSDVAELAGAAPSTVVRACQRLGFRGFQEVKVEAARLSPRQQSAPGDQQHPAARALAETVRAAAETLDGLSATLTPDQLAAAARLLDAAPRVLVFGAGLSGAVAADAGYRLRALACAVDDPADPMTAQLAAGQLPTGSACLLISHTGATRTTVEVARRARACGAEVIAVTSYARSPLTGTSTCVLVAGGQDLVFGLETTASRLAHLVVVDALGLTLLGLRGPRAEQALQLSADVTAGHLY